MLRPRELSDEAKGRMARAVTDHIADVQQRADAVSDILIRAWCVEQAVKACGDQGGGIVWGAGPLSPEQTEMKSAVIPLAREIHSFVLESITPEKQP